MEQNTPEWLEMRKTHIGSSDAPIVMNVSPFKTPFRLWQEKIGIRESDAETFAMSEGKRKEPLARKALEEQLGMPLFPSIKLHNERSWQMASLDAMSFDERTIAEIKCPGRVDQEMAASGIVPDKYFPQLQHQISVCDVDFAYYFSFDGEKGVVIKVFRDEKYIQKMIQEEERFFECMQNFESPAMTDRDYQIQTSHEWGMLAFRWNEISNQLRSLEEQEKIVKSQLISLCNDQSSMGAGVKLAKCVRKGTVDYSKIPEIEGLNLESYRKPSSEYWRIGK